MMRTRTILNAVAAAAAARLAGERGSLPLALLVTFVAGTLTAAVTTVTIGEMRAVRHDERFTRNVQVADSGVSDALHRLNNQILREGDPLTPVSGSVGGTSYTWTPTRTPAQVAAREWEITSVTGTGSGARTVKAIVREDPLWGVAAFADLTLQFNGGNSADSYSSATQTWMTGLGTVGTNGTVNLNGASTTVDRVLLYDWAAAPDNGRCVHSGNPISCSTATPQPANGKRTNIDPRLDIRSPARTEFVSQQLADPMCANTVVDWVASLQPGGNPKVLNLTPGNYCFRRVIIDADTVLPASVTAANPLRLVVTDYFMLDRQTSFNCEDCANPPTTAGPCATVGAACPAAGRVQIHSLRATASDGSHVIRVYNQAELAAAVYAPNASCGSPSSTAQTQIYGSLICTDIANQGGWGFHYDDALAGAAGAGEFTVVRWWEP